MNTERFARMLGAGALALGLASIGAAGAAAQTPGTLEIHKAVCPVTTGATIFEECHDDGLGDVTFEVIHGGEAGYRLIETGSDGRAVTDFAGTGEMFLLEWSDSAANPVGAYVYCRDLIADETLFDGRAIYGDAGYYSIALDVTDDMHIVCDWYNLVPAGDSAPVDGPTAPKTGGGVMAGAGLSAAAMAVPGLLALAGGLAARRRR